MQLVQAGQEKKQAVGYLDDGTMVVVDDSRDMIGQSVAVELTRVLQTTAGRMMFARRTAKQSNERTYVESKARGSMFASPKGDKKHSEAKPSRSETVKKEQLQPVTQDKPSSTNRKPRRRQKRSAEDKLVDLANN